MASNETIQFQHFLECDVCKNPATFFCRRCVTNLCDACVPTHLRVKSKNVHDVVDNVNKDDDETCTCDSHPQEECCTYCKTCETPICLVCVSIKHKSHEMSELSEKIEDLMKVIMCENERLQSFKTELEKILDHTTKRLFSLSKIYRQRKEEVTARGEEWQKHIEELVKNLHKELDEMQKEHDSVLQKQKDECEKILAEIDIINKKTMKFKKSKNVEEMKKIIPMIEKQTTGSNFAEWSFPVFCESKIEENVLKTYFGYIERMRERKISVQKLMVNPVDNILSCKKIIPPKVIATIETGFVEDENKYRLFDMAVTRDKKVWISGTNGELKLFDLQGILHKTIRISVLCTNITVYKTEVVFSATAALKKISNYNTEVTLFKTGDWNPFGITTTMSDDLLVCLCKDNQSKVVRYSATGTVLQEIQFDSQSQPLYNKINYIAENVNGDIIVADWGKGALIAVNKLGLFCFSCAGNENIFHVCGITTDPIGHIIVTDYIGDKIHMLDMEGQFLRYIILDQGIQRPCALCIVNDGEMIVGESMNGTVKRIKYME
ncbi:uncharacterized protein LOC133187096 [Saccostrea echinata]|uniref:uncharacterized protein LOC133187096 n=1 Tax=Saccostrea echinata TaxID=191078 RepID=UPI002A835E27|nr:uncharacterized protein LOC133187096 [Saccostrea echinata]